MCDTKDTDNERRGVKRKRQKSFLKNAKKYGRKGQYGCGSELDADTYQYMVRILDLMRDGFPSLDEKLVFVNNVYEQTKEHEVEYARNQVGSRVLDSLLIYANFEVIQRLDDAFNKALRPICSDRFASHVLQKLIVVCAERGNRSANVKENLKAETSESIEYRLDVKNTEVQSYNNLVLKLSKYVINNMEDFVWDTYANHVLRTIIKTLAGFIDLSDDQNKKKTTLFVYNRHNVIQEYNDLLFEACNRLIKWPQFSEFGENELTSGLLQVILHSLKDINSKLNSTIIKKIRDECFTCDEELGISNAFNTVCSTRLLETCIAMAKPKLYIKIYSKYFAGRLNKLSLLEGANFSVQRLLDHCNVKEDLERMFDEMSECYEEILMKRYTGILVSMANACVRLRTKQGAFMTVITKVLKCDEPMERQMKMLIPIISLVSYEQIEASNKENSFTIHLHGSLIVQALLNFNKPIKIVSSLLTLNSEQLAFLFNDPRGSRVMDAFVESEYVGEKSREKLARKLQGTWVKLACGTHGSRSLEKIWQRLQLGQRLRVMEELASVGESLHSTKSGKIISSKLNVPLFVRNQKNWLESLGKEDKTKALFANIITKPLSK